MKYKVELVITLFLLAITMSGCSSKSVSKSSMIKKDSVDERLVDAVFRADFDLAKSALASGGNPNYAIMCLKYTEQVSLSCGTSTLLNAVVSSYTYKNRGLRSPRSFGHGSSQNALGIAKLLLEAGAVVKNRQFTGGYKYGSGISFEEGVMHLASIMPILMEYGFKPTIEDIDSAYSFDSSYTKPRINLAFEQNPKFLDYLKTRVNETKKGVLKNIEAYEADKLKERQEAQRKLDEKRIADEALKKKLDWVESHKLKNPVVEGQKICLFNENTLTSGFADRVGAGNVKFFASNKYWFNHLGVNLGSISKTKLDPEWIEMKKIFRCPQGI